MVLRPLTIIYPSFSVFSRPDFGDLKEVCGSVPTPFGPVQVEAKRNGKKCVKIPDGLTQE